MVAEDRDTQFLRLVEQAVLRLRAQSVGAPPPPPEEGRWQVEGEMQQFKPGAPEFWLKAKAPSRPLRRGPRACAVFWLAGALAAG
jgi:hypothetical protein